MIRAAIVGLGGWGRRLVASVQEDGQPRGSEIYFTHAAVRSPARAQPYANRQRLRLASYEACLADPNVDAVVLATPHSLHPGQVCAAAGAGKHVFVEKPLALTLAEAQSAIAACAAAGRVLALGHNRRFLPAFRALRDLLRAGELGTILHAEALFAGAFGLAYTPDAWRAGDADAPAGGLTAMGIHSLDALIDGLGPVEEVTAQSMRRALAIPMDDTTSAMLRFRSGPSGHVATLMATAWTWQLRVFGVRGYALMPDETSLQIVERSGVSRHVAFPVLDTERVELEAFARAVRGDEAYPVPLDEVAHGVAVLEATIASIRSGGVRMTVEA
ncbi:Gfo/Idh/MocA family oxidoreductase [uncultured Methylobacterium sp.]|uniref:Gfo/Idh/MocA family protein n=1 Tax=uncultured Methylobacterium sp. TaxID=157278 RepID=UPI0025861FF5|nr:Gfo/Idh/MocA family oxidoreductase [uncultured Methylobacterium sp.]